MACALLKSSVLLCVILLLAKGLNAKDIHKEMFSAYGGKCLSRNDVHIWVAKVSLVTKWLILYESGSDYSKKAMGQI
jgi:hypothetical protein